MSSTLYTLGNPKPELGIRFQKLLFMVVYRKERDMWKYSFLSLSRLEFLFYCLAASHPVHHQAEIASSLHPRTPLCSPKQPAF